MAAFQISDFEYFVPQILSSALPECYCPIIVLFVPFCENREKGTNWDNGVPAAKAAV